MTKQSKLLLAALTVLGLIVFGLGGLAGPAYADAGTQVADCTFATLQADLQSGGDYYYAKGQCPNPITFDGTITIEGAAAALTAQGGDVILQGTGNHCQAFSCVGQNIQLFQSIYGGNLTLTGLTLSRGASPLGGVGGGAIGAFGGSTLTVIDCTFSNNSDGEDPTWGGGAIFNGGGGNLTISGSTFSQNGDYSDYGIGGGAIWNQGTLNISNSTFAENFAEQYGSAIYNEGGSVTLANSTVAQNYVGFIDHPSVPALYSEGGPFSIGGTLIADHGTGTYSGVTTVGANCSATIIDEGYNLADDSSCGFSAANHDVVGQDAQLDPNGLQSNGGPTQTVALQVGSPAVDTIPTSSGLCPADDQRGMPRPDNTESTCDIGAYEYQDPPTVPTTTTLTSAPDPSVVGQQVTYTATVAPVPDGGTVSFTDGGSTISGCASRPLDSSGRAACQLAYPSTGTHSIGAAYSGDPGYLSSAAATLTETVNKVSTRTALASSANPAIAGRQVSYTAMISPAPDGGTVAFTDNGTTISGCGTVPITTSGAVSCPVSYPTAGTHTVTATYSGDSSYAASTSTGLSQTVTSDLTTTLALKPNPVARGGTLSVTYSAKNAGTLSRRVTVSYTLTDPHGTATTTSAGTVTINAGNTLTKSVSYKVPRTATTGTWTVAVTASDITGSSTSTAQVTVT